MIFCLNIWHQCVETDATVNLFHAYKLKNKDLCKLNIYE